MVAPNRAWSVAFDSNIINVFDHGLRFMITLFALFINRKTGIEIFIIADLEGSPDIQTHHLSEAVGYRNLDRESWGE